MNTLNYATLPASKRLVEAGIVLETEAVWRKKRDKTGYYLSRKALYHRTTDIPAPSMAEVWRELPSVFKRGDEFFTLLLEPDNGDDTTIACYAKGDKTAVWTKSANPTDALIDLLIWFRKEADHE